MPADLTGEHALMAKIYQEVKAELAKHGIKEGSASFDEKMMAGIKHHKETSKLSHLKAKE